MSHVTGEDFEGAYQGMPPWEIDAPQPEVVRLLDEGAFRGSVIDVGCGTGENALLLAQRGHPVLGLDASATAIARAGEKAEARGLALRLARGDALDLEGLRERFETALDSGLFHVFDDAQRRRYAESMAAALGPGAQLHLICFSDAEPPGWGPRRVSEWDLRSTFRGSFALTRLRAGRFSLRPPRDFAQAWVATLTRV